MPDLSALIAQATQQPNPNQLPQTQPVLPPEVQHLEPETIAVPPDELTAPKAPSVIAVHPDEPTAAVPASLEQVPEGQDFSPLRDFDAKGIAEAAIKEPEFDPITLFTQLPPELQSDPGIRAKTAEAFHILRERAEKNPLADITPGSVLSSIGGMAKGFWDWLYNTGGAATTAALSGTPLAGKDAEGMYDVAKRQAGESIASLQLAGLQLGYTGEKLTKWIARHTLKDDVGSSLWTKDLKAYNPQDKADALENAVAAHNLFEKVSTGGKLDQKIVKDLEQKGLPFRPEVVGSEATGNPFAFEAMGKAMGAAGALVPKEASALLNATVGKANVIAPKVAGAVTKGVGIGTEKVGQVTKYLSKFTKSGVGEFLGAEILGPPGVFVAKLIEKGAEKLPEIGEKMVNAGKELGGKVVSPTGQALTDAVQTAPQALQHILSGAAFDLAFAETTSETPEERKGVGFGTMVGALGAAHGAASHMVSGQLIGKRFGAYTPEMTQKFLDTVAPGTEFKQFSVKNSEGVHSDALSQQAAEQWLVGKGVDPAEAARMSKAAGVTQKLPDGKTYAIQTVDRTTHEAVHAIQSTWSPEQLEATRKYVRDRYTDEEWNAEKKNVAERLHKNFENAPLGDKSPDEYIHTATGQEADEYINDEIQAEHLTAFLQHAGPSLKEGKSLPEYVARGAAAVIKAMGGNPLEGRLSPSPALQMPLKSDIVTKLASDVRAKITPESEAAATGVAKEREKAAKLSGATTKAKTWVAEQEKAQAITPEKTAAINPVIEQAAKPSEEQKPMKVLYRTAPEERGIGQDPTSDRFTRRAEVKAGMQLPPEQRDLREITIQPIRTENTSEGPHIIATSPDSLEANLAKVNKFFSEVEAKRPGSIKRVPYDPRTTEGRAQLEKDVRIYNENQRLGFTGSGKSIVVPPEVTAIGAGKIYKPTETGTPVRLDQDIADLINYLYNDPIPEGSTSASGKVKMAKVHLLQQKVAEATIPGAGRVQVPVTPHGEFSEKQLTKAGFPPGKPEGIREVNPIRQWIEQTAHDLGITAPSPIDAILRLRASRIEDSHTLAEEPKLPTAGSNPLTRRMGFEPMPDSPRAIKDAALRDTEGKIYTGRYHGEAAMRAAASGHDGGELEAGWTTNEGEFLNRDAALQRALELKQIEKGRANEKEGLHSGDIHFEPHDTSVIGPDGKEYKVRYDGVQDFSSVRPGAIWHQMTALEDMPGTPKGSTTYAHALEKRGYKVPDEFRGTPPPSQLPGTKFEPNTVVQQVAKDYMESLGRPYSPHLDYQPVDVEKGKRIADYFESAKSNPEDPAVKKAYAAYTTEIKQQWQHMKDAGVIVERWEKEGQPYKNSMEMMKDIRDNHHLFFFPVSSGFGGGEELNAAHPMLADSGVNLGSGKNLVMTELNRAVHDYFGHAQTGFEFGPKGEYNAFLSHAKMFSPEAIPAMASENLGQNSWVNFGRHLRDSEGNIPKSGQPGYVAPSDRPFSEQKAMVLPPELIPGSARTGLAFKKFFADVAAGKFGKSEVPFVALQDLSDVKAVEDERMKHWSNFEHHIQRSIPMIHEEKTRLADGVIKTFGEGARMLDIGSSEGDFGKAISALSKGKIETVSLDPNPQMAQDFHDVSQVPGATHTGDAFLNGFEDEGKTIPAHNPAEPYDVINEAVTFQFIDPNRDAQVAEVKRMLKPDGIFISAEKFKTKDWAANEKKKDTDYKAKYFSDEALAAKEKRVGFQQSKQEEKAVGMVDNMVSDTDFEQTLGKHFDHVVQYWDAGNFKGYAASDNPAKLNELVKNIGDLNSDFSTVSTPRKVSFEPEGPQTQAGRDLEKDGYTFIREDHDGGALRLAFLDESGKIASFLDAVPNFDNPKELYHVANVNTYTGHSRKGLASALYRELGTILQQRNAKLLTGAVVGQGPSNIRKNVFGEPVEDTQLAAEGPENFRRITSKIDPKAKYEPEAFYSQLDRTIEDKFSGKEMPVDQLKAVLTNPKNGVKADELKWSGLDDFLKDKKRVTKQEVQDHLKENAVKVEVLTHGEESGFVESWWNDEGGANEETPWGELTPEEQRRARRRFQDEVGDYEEGAPKFGKYQLPGGENYREVLFQIPERNHLQYTNENVKQITEPSPETPDHDTFWYYRTPDNLFQIPKSKYKREVDARAYIIREKQPQVSYKDNYQSKHWNEVNVVAHARANDRVDTAGSAGTLLEEVQSDWHQEGRKKGYQQPPSPEAEKEYSDLQTRLSSIDDQMAQMDSPEGVKTRNLEERYKLSDESNKIRARMQEIYGASRLNEGKVPNAPFKTTWHEMVFRKMLHEAATQGKEWLGWTTGEQQAERYDLSKSVKRINYTPKTKELTAVAHDGSNVIRETVAPDKLPEFIGKEAAEKILSAPLDESGIASLTGDDLKVGGAGMKGFYDKMLVDYANKFGNKFGAKVVDREIPQMQELPNGWEVGRNEDGWIVWDDQGEVAAESKDRQKAIELAQKTFLTDNNPTNVVHSLEITPAMRESVSKGVPLFEPQANENKVGQGVKVSDKIRGVSKNLDLVHYSQASNLKETDPAFHGTGIPGAESARRRDYPEIYSPRTYFGMDGYVAEPGLGEARYKASVPLKALYDFQRDPKNLYPSAAELEKSGYAPFDQRAKVTLYENRIKKAGFKGYVNSEAKVAAVFEKTPVKRFEPKAEQDFFEGIGNKEVLSSVELSDMTKAELAAHFPESIIPETRDDKIDYGIVKSPLFKEAANEDVAVKSFSRRLVDFAKKYRDTPEFKSGTKWYSEFVPMLKKVYGKHAELMAQLLAATSPRNSPQPNFGLANDALQGFKGGRFDKQVQKYLEGMNKIDNGTWEKWYQKEHKAGKLINGRDNPTPEAFMAEWIFRHQLQPKQSNGKLYGMHSTAVLQVLAGKWLTENTGPKTHQFVKNLLGTHNGATIDLWAARTMRRVGYEGFKDRWRILPGNETGVSAADFAFSQKAFAHAAAELGLTPDALQGGLWFAEKRLWADNGWGRLDLGDYRNEIKKVELLNSGIEQRLATVKAQEKAKTYEPMDLLSPR